MTHNNWLEDGFTWTTYAERLEDAGISWKAYSHQEGHIYNRLQSFRNFGRRAPAIIGSPLLSYQGNGDLFRRPVRVRRDSRQAARRLLALPDGHSVGASRLHAGRGAPHLSQASSMQSLPIQRSGRRRRSSSTTMRTMASSIMYRRLFLHQARRKSLSTDCPSAAAFVFHAFSSRPGRAGGWVCSQPFDHTSVLQFLEKFTGVREPNISDWRRHTFWRSDLGVSLQPRHRQATNVA